MIKSRVGAPIGGRVHWFIWFLPRSIKDEYKISFDYEYHNYHLQRLTFRTVIDEFIVVRTSRRCWRCMYFHHKFLIFKYFSARTSKELGYMIFDTYAYYKKAEDNLPDGA